MLRISSVTYLPIESEEAKEIYNWIVLVQERILKSSISQGQIASGRRIQKQKDRHVSYLYASSLQLAL